MGGSLVSLIYNFVISFSFGNRKLVDERLAQCSIPLYVKLVFDEIKLWKSYTHVQEKDLAKTVSTSINKLLGRIESQHGHILVGHALSYITASKSGLSEAELEDLISLDETVLNDVYQYHLPPIRRIPPLLWTRIRNDLPNYLVEREAEGVSVVCWYHRQFAEGILPFLQKGFEIKSGDFVVFVDVKENDMY